MMIKPTNELRRLVDGMLDGTLDPEQLEKLEALLGEDQEAMDYYLDMAGLDGAVKTALAEHQPLSETRVHRKTILFSLLAAAAVILLAAVVIMKPGVATLGHEGNEFATVTDRVGVVWSDRERSVGSVVYRGNGTLEIESGLLEITHSSGTRLLIEGPALYEVTGPNSGRFERGKLVAEVPPGAEGFTVDSPDGRVVDFGTEFALMADPDAGTMEVGVFRGEVKVWPGRTGEEGGEVPLYTGHAVRMPGKVESPLRSIPFDQDNFIRRSPSRELPWYYDGSGSPLEWDVSHLIWSAGDHLVVLKWMSGPQAMVLEKTQLLLDGQVVAEDVHPSSIGNSSSTHFNLYRMNVPDDGWRRGKWTLKAFPSRLVEAGDSEGILIVEDGGVTEATAEQFVGVWEYVHDGVVYRRTFNEDGTCLLEFNGQPTPYFESASWEVKNGILIVHFDASDVVEQHLLRDRESLVFINLPYRNARRIERGE